MSYATILVYMNADHVPGYLLDVAISIANKHASKLIGLSALAIPPPFVAEGVVIVDPATEADIANMKAVLSAAGRQFELRVGADRRPEWRAAIAFPTDTLVAQSRSADLIMLEQSVRSGDIYRTIDVGAAILGAGRPFLLVPSSVKTLSADRVVIAWKDTREARRAVGDALPFLHQAKHVTVLEVCETGQGEAARSRVDDVISYLERHRIKAERRVEPRAHGSGADQVIGLADDEGADLLVAGAYGHNRFNEWVFGGMTRDLLTSSPFCCLMSH